MLSDFATLLRHNTTERFLTPGVDVLLGDIVLLIALSLFIAGFVLR